MATRRWPEPFEFQAAPPFRLYRLMQVFSLAAVLIAGFADWNYLRHGAVDRRFYGTQLLFASALAFTVISTRFTRRRTLSISVTADSMLRIDGQICLPAARPLGAGPWLWIAVRSTESADATTQHILEFSASDAAQRALIRRWMLWAEVRA